MQWQLDNCNTLLQTSNFSLVWIVELMDTNAVGRAFAGGVAGLEVPWLRVWIEEMYGKASKTEAFWNRIHICTSKGNGLDWNPCSLNGKRPCVAACNKASGCYGTGHKSFTVLGRRESCSIILVTFVYFNEAHHLMRSMQLGQIAD